MINTDMYRKQHDGLMVIAGKISNKLNVSKLKKDETEVRTLLCQLAGKLSVHLAMEDDSLYPVLLKHPEENVRKLTEQYKQEMGGIANTFKSYMDKWRPPHTILNNPDEFVSQTEQIFTALSGRIKRENNELYMVAEKE